MNALVRGLLKTTGRTYSNMKNSSTIDEENPILPGDPRSDWYNFGYWNPGTTDFDRASEALAFKLGQLAELKACPHLLDVGPGFGAQLALWKTDFQVVRVTALEPNHRSWLRAKVYEDPTISVLCSRLEEYSPESAVKCAIAVDSCYHIPYNLIWQKLMQLSGLTRVVLSDFYLLRTPTSFFDRFFLRMVALSARIPHGNFRTKEEYLRTSRMQLSSWEDVSVQVVDGFCNYVSNQFAKRSFFQTLFNADALKVYCTYLMLRRLRLMGLVGYALIVFKPKL